MGFFKSIKTFSQRQKKVSLGIYSINTLQLISTALKDNGVLCKTSIEAIDVNRFITVEDDGEGCVTVMGSHARNAEKRIIDSLVKMSKDETRSDEFISKCKKLVGIMKTGEREDAVKLLGKPLNPFIQEKLKAMKADVNAKWVKMIAAEKEFADAKFDMKQMLFEEC